jgi:hypothetical protein
MPYKLLAHRDGTFSVQNTETKKLLSKKTTMKNAVAQIRFLQALEHGFRPSGRR